MGIIMFSNRLNLIYFIGKNREIFMKTIHLLIISTIFLLFLSCKSLEYVDDLTYMSPNKAGYPSFLVLVNGKSCKDMFGEIGHCSFKNRIDQPIIVELLSQPYDYKIDFRCGNKEGIKFRKQQDIFSGIKLKFEIPSEIMKGQRYFNCIGDVIPLDERENTASNFFEMRIRFYSKNFIESSDIFTIKYKGKKYLVLGKNAYRAKVKIGRKWYHLKKQTTFKYKSKIDFAVSETKNMRRSYYGEL